MAKDKLPREIWVLVAAAVAVSLGYGIVAPVLPRFAKSFGVTTTASSIVVSAFAFMRLSFAPASGRLSSRFGERRMYMVGISLVSLSSALSGFAQNYWQLLIFRGAGGIGSVTFTVAAMSLIFRLAPPAARGRASAAYGSGFLLGNIMGPVVGALLAPLGYRWPFYIYAVLLLVAGAIVGVLVPQHVAPSRAAREAEIAPDQRRHLLGPMTVREALNVRRFRVVLLTSFAQGWTNMGVRVAIVPLLASSIPGAPNWLAGAALMTFAAGNGLALARAGYWSDVYGRKPIVIVGLMVSGTFTLFMGTWAVSSVVLIGSFFGGFGSGCVQPSQQGTVADIVGDREGSRVVSFFQQAGDFGQIFGPIVAGMLVDVSGYTLAYGVSGGILLVAGMFWILFVDRQRLHGRRKPAQA